MTTEAETIIHAAFYCAAVQAGGDMMLKGIKGADGWRFRMEVDEFAPPDLIEEGNPHAEYPQPD
jgi:hypothetical protein